ncbi:MAG: pyridoxal phosphate-dependent aminotransferase, partial [Pseudomonadota bacterium]
MASDTVNTAIKTAQRLQNVKSSPTLAVTQKVAELRAMGREVLALGAGEPDFKTPKHIQQAAVDALNAGHTGYTPADGIPELKQAIIDKFSRDNGLEYTPAQILVSVGGKHSCYNLAQALINPGDEVIIPAPYWTSYPDIVKLAGGNPVIVQTGIERNFKITPDQLRTSITEQTKLFMINSPSNPTGMNYTPEELAELGQVLLDAPRVVIATDDMYEHVRWSGEFVNIVNACPALYDRTLVMNGVSKAYAMTGWRIGYVGGPESLVSAMKKVQSQTTSNPTSISQYAACEALNGDQSFVAKMVKAFKARHDFVVDALLQIEGIKCQPNDGTFYCFPNIQGLLDRLPDIQNDTD